MCAQYTHAVSRHHCNTFHTKPLPVRYKALKSIIATMSSVDQLEKSMTLLQQVNNCKCQATLYLRQDLIYYTSFHPLQFTIHYSPPHNHTHCIECTCTLYCDSMIPCKWQLRTVLLWQLYMFVGTMSIQRTHAKQCKDSLLLYTHIHRCTTCTRASLPTVSPLLHSTTKHTSALFPKLPRLEAPQPTPLQHGPTWEP